MLGERQEGNGKKEAGRQGGRQRDTERHRHAYTHIEREREKREKWSVIRSS